MSEYYISSSAAPTGDGTIEKPASVSMLLGEMPGGNTYKFLAGEYPPLEIPNRLAGRPEAPTVLMSVAKYGAVVMGSPGQGVSGSGIGTKTDGCPWLTLDGFEVSGCRKDGVHLYGEGLVVRNCYTHGNTVNGITLRGDGHGNLIERCLSEYNGTHRQFHHGIYAKCPNITIRANIVRHNACSGIQVCPIATDSLIVYNLAYGNPKHACICGYDVPSGGNKILHNTFLSDTEPALRVRNNVGVVVGNNILINWSGNSPILLENCTDIERDFNSTNENGLFESGGKGMYYLRTDSPACLAGSPRYTLMAAGINPDVMPTDFWGNPLLLPKPDLGCFAYRAEVLDPTYRATWHEGWAYAYNLNAGYDLIPDLWRLP